jgi:hypothetical protein
MLPEIIFQPCLQRHVSLKSIYHAERIAQLVIQLHGEKLRGVDASWKVINPG